jgi:hypothetical protein
MIEGAADRFFSGRSVRALGLVLLLLIGGASILPTAEAQDRSVPRFGPLVTPDTVQARLFDLGRLWSFARPPLDYFEEQYRVAADERGLQHARLGTVRLPGCSGALVSPQGLVLTAARCVRSDAGSESLSASFYAEEQQQERELSLSAERVVEIRPVTMRVDSLMAEGTGAETDTSATWTGAVEQVERQLQAEAPSDHSVDVVREAGGTQYVAYHYRRYEDVRLVFLPDPEVRLGAQIDEVLTYPQYAWDVAALRIYEDGAPLATENHFELRSQGARPGDAVFAVGFPEATRRAETHHQLAFRRDVRHPDRVARLESWTAHLQQYVDTVTTRGQWEHRLREDRVALKYARAQLESLQNAYVMARLQRRDDAVRQGDDPAATLMNELENLQDEKRSDQDRYRAFSFLLHPTHSSATLRRALRAYEAMTDGSSSSAGTSLEAISDQPPALDAALLADHLHRLRTHLPADSALTRTLEQIDAAEVVQRSVLSASDAAQTAFQNRDLPEDDPALALVAAFYDQYAAFGEEWSALQGREQGLTDRLAQIRHRSVPHPIALPRSRALRIADGRIRGYPYNGTLAPPFTTFYGLYGRHVSSAVPAGSRLPERWRTPSSAFDRSVPLTTVSSTDLGGGAYGGPLLNSSLQLVGIVADGNVQSAAGDFLFLPRRMRTVSVDVRGVLEGLSSVYNAEALVQEMTGESVSAP